MKKIKNKAMKTKCTEQMIECKRERHRMRKIIDRILLLANKCLKFFKNVQFKYSHLRMR